MIVIINQLLEKKQKTIYWLSKEIGCDYQSLKRLCSNESTSVSFDLAEKICIALNCTMSDIFIIQK